MKYQPGFTDFFMSPVTGRIILPAMPDLYQDYVWVGNRDDRPLPSPILIDLRLEIVDLRRRLSETRFILQRASNDFDQSQALNELIPGILRHTDGVVAIAMPWVDYVPPTLPYRNIWIGDEDSVPQPYERIFLQNLPSMFSADPTKLLGAYNLYSGSADVLTLGEPQIVKTLHITNLPDLEQGHLWLGKISVDPLNLGLNRPVPIIVLPLDNMADLPENKIWRGDSSDRPVPSDALTDIEQDIEDIQEDIADIYEQITEINTEIGDITIDLGDLLEQISSILESIATITSNISSIFESIATITTQITSILEAITSINAQITSILEAITNINLRLDGIDLTLGDLQAQIDAGISSGLDHLADLQGQIDAGISSGLDHLADLQGQIDAGIASGMDHLATINSRLDALESVVITIQDDITDIYSQITTINTTLTSLQTQIDTINTSITTINSTLTSLQTQINTINSTITTIQSNITTINGQITTINSTIVSIQGDITNITTVLLPAVYTYIDTAITNITNNFVAGGVIDMDGNAIKNLPCIVEDDNDAISFCFLWHILHDEVTVTWP